MKTIPNFLGAKNYIDIKKVARLGYFDLLDLA
mgnify:CR=1 FL=1